MNVVYESKTFIILLLNGWSCFYKIIFDENNLKMTVCNVDETYRGYILQFQIINKLTKNCIEIQFEQSNYKCTTKEINLTPKKQIVSLTTTPSRIKCESFIKNIKQLTQNQILPIEKIIINIPYKYLRFAEKIEESTLNMLINLPKVQVNMLEKDHGPASKYLGPLIKNREDLFDSLLIIVDDDKFYSPYLVQNFNICVNTFKDCKFLASDWSLYFDVNYINLSEKYIECYQKRLINDSNWFRGCGVAGFMGFAFNFTNKELFKDIDTIIEYHEFVHNRVNNSIFHDDAVMTGYLKQREEQIAFLKHVSFNKDLNTFELPDPLYAQTHIKRRSIEKQIFNLKYEK